MTTEMEIEEEFARVKLTRSALRRLLRHLRPHRGRVWVALTLEVLWVVSMLVDVRLIREAVDGPVLRGELGDAALYAAWMVANLVFRQAITVWELRTMTGVGIQVLHEIRREVFDHIQRLSMRYFDRTKQGRIIARADRDVDTLEHIMLWGPVILVSLAFCMALGFVQLCLGSPRMAFWVVPAVPVLLALTQVFEHIGFPAYRRVRETHSAISSHVAETITGVRVVMAFCAEGREREKLETLQTRYRRAVLTSHRLAGAYVPSLSFVFHALLVLVLIVGGAEVLRGETTVGGLLELVLLLGFVVGPVEGLGGLYNESLVAGAAAERIFLLLDTEPEVRDRPEARDPGRLLGEIEFDRVSFAYDPQGRWGPQLVDVSFRVAPGETVALVGHTGAGKTSVANLVARFYEAQQGVVRIDGHDVRAIPAQALHRQMGIVLQESFLFAGSVLDNLRFSRPDLAREEARAGFEELGCAEVLDGLADGLDTDVGERGANLSEGERQIVCFVRAHVARPAILVLDEATSAVDTRQEALLLRALRALASRQTTIVIAHRLSTIRDADRILVLDHGRLVEQGRHADLVARGGVYAALYRDYARA